MLTVYFYVKSISGESKQKFLEFKEKPQESFVEALFVQWLKTLEVTESYDRSSAYWWYA